MFLQLMPTFIVIFFQLTFLVLEITVWRTFSGFFIPCCLAFCGYIIAFFVQKTYRKVPVLFLFGYFTLFNLFLMFLLLGLGGLGESS